MTIGEVIRKYRKAVGLTQEQAAVRLGVTAPAVNKWEKGSSQPDVALLAPIARLLGITTDTLLSFKDDLTDGEIRDFIHSIDQALEERAYSEVFAAVKQKIEEYPNCERLIWQSALILDARRLVGELPDRDDYEDTILGWYERCLASADEGIKNQAAQSLFHAFVRKEEYEKALGYAAYLSRENPERKRMEALVGGKTGKKQDAYRAYEELLFSGCQQLQVVLNDLRILYLEDGDYEMADKMAEVQSKTAAAFEMGRYAEVSVFLDNAAARKDVPRTERAMRDILSSVDTLGDFAKSRLYAHMTFKPVDEDFKRRIHADLAASFQDDEVFGYMRGSEYREGLKALS